MLTVFLSRSDVSRHTQALHLLPELGEALKLRTKGPSSRRLDLEAPGRDGATVVRTAALEGVPAYAVTTQVRQGDGSSRAVLQLHDGPTGKLLALMDAGHSRALRASLVGALSADALARPDARHVAVLGSGAAAIGALKALRLVRSVEQVWLFEADLARSFELALHLQATLSMAVRGAPTAAAAVAEADIVLLTGEETLPSDSVKRGAHVAVLGAESFPTCPLPPETLERARRFCDEPETSPRWGPPFQLSLGGVLRGDDPGRTSPDEVTLFASTGPAFLDLIVAWHVYQGARDDDELTRLDLEA